jgi:hypothetical protein
MQKKCKKVLRNLESHRENKIKKKKRGSCHPLNGYQKIIKSARPKTDKSSHKKNLKENEPHGQGTLIFFLISNK